MTWTCPRCQRMFAFEGQFHSHDIVDLDAHFADRPLRLRAAFDKLVESMPTDVRVDVLPSAIILAAKATFSFIIVQRHRLLVSVFLDRRVDSPRIVKVDAVSPTKIENVIEVRGPDDVDNVLHQWLVEAHRLRSAS